jgi:hypothetical protein
MVTYGPAIALKGGSSQVPGSLQIPSGVLYLRH